MIGKTRHSPEARKSPLPASLRQRLPQTCGDLIKDPQRTGEHRHARFAPTPALACWIEHFWLESWSVRLNATETRELLPLACGPGLLATRFADLRRAQHKGALFAPTRVRVAFSA